jgi:SAM-dependent methyltransferase
VDDSTYALDNAAPQAGQRFTSLETLFDPVTFRNLGAAGAGAGLRCLEIGVGGGSVARWLAAQVGPAGHVLATDIDPHWFAVNDLPAIEVRRHDITRDPLPEAAFDLIHARLVLIHIPDRVAVLRRLVVALRPGGRLAIEDFDVTLIPRRVNTGEPEHEVVNTVTAAFSGLLAARGADHGYGKRLPALLRAAGLTDVHAEGHVAFATGGSPGAALYLANIQQTRAELLAAGHVTKDEIERCCELLADPSVTLTMPVLIAARGRKPG